MYLILYNSQNYKIKFLLFTVLTIFTYFYIILYLFNIFNSYSIHILFIFSFSYSIIYSLSNNIKHFCNTSILSSNEFIAI